MDNARDFLIDIQHKKNASNVKNGSISVELAKRKNILDLNILICLDISASISSAQFKQFMAQIKAIKGLSRVKVLEIDTQIVAFYDYFSLNQRSVVRLGGGGGTEFTPAFKKIEQLHPDAVLFMTDGFVYDTGRVKKPACPVGWILTNNGKQPYDFGEIIVRLD